MTGGDYFFFVFLGTIAVARLVLAIPKSKRPSSIIGSIHVRHYMLGIVLAIIAALIRNEAAYAIGLGLIADELPPLLVKGPGYRDEQWRGCEDYFTAWTVAGVFLVTLIVYLMRNYFVL